MPATLLSEYAPIKTTYTLIAEPPYPICCSEACSPKVLYILVRATDYKMLCKGAADLT
jgi:hypothetical protein